MGKVTAEPQPPKQEVETWLKKNKTKQKKTQQKLIYEVHVSLD